ncbi:aminoglycoside phosphotransferase [Paenibacillus psychroresistens]|uniref:Aminoglycoside phosphotransferase n=1 Tax=Paenibacillus psychroresistens TaxID=1778678 RepID=A0A6B8RU25_9BACL|nr:phosphotransferase [Paenibacillus psychroresistens]QGQ99427.1 aminoglycoside phosphotransferase [Paenibacillus psychroresistens]
MNANKQKLDHVLRVWFPLDEWSISSGSSGMNNTTQYVEVNKKSYVLRVYETHRDEAKVRYEHAVLLGLAKLELPFSTPVPVLAGNGESFMRMEAEDGQERGKLACLFHYIAGERPDLEQLGQIQSLGRTTAQLALALQQLELTLEPEYPTYYQLGLAESATLFAEIIQFCLEPAEPFWNWRGELGRLAELLNLFTAEAPKLQKLPHQLIHGDLNASNSLIGANQEVAAILDFEFITMDLRVMEIAVCLADAIAEEAVSEQVTWDKIEAYIRGYGSAAKLSVEEVAVLPLLIQLRRLDVFVHFIGRYKNGIDSVSIVEEMIRSAIAVDSWLSAHEARLLGLGREYLLIKMP